MRSNGFVTRALVVGCLVAITPTLVACLLDRTGRAGISPMRLSATPPLICADEVVAVSWSCMNAGGSPICDTAEVTSIVGDAFGPFTDKSGDRSTAFGQDTTLQIVATLDDESESATVDIEVVGEDSLHPLDRTFVGECSGSTPTWSTLDLTAELSPCVAIAEVVNRSPFNVEINLDDGRSVVLMPGRGATIEVAGPAERMTARALNLPPDPSRCGALESSSMPPDLDIRIFTQCDRSLPRCGG